MRGDAAPAAGAGTLAAVVFTPLASDAQARAPSRANALAMARARRRASRKKKASARHIAEVKQRIETQRRRRKRPMLPVNTQVRVSDTMIARKRKEERKHRQRRDWDAL